MKEEIEKEESGAGVDTDIEAGEANPYVRAVQILNKAFDHFNEKYCDNLLKRPLITILSRGRKACLGWHWKNKWNYQDSLHTEIMIAAEALRRPVPAILETLLHEMVHLWNSQHDIPDCNASQYHNKAFKKTAEGRFHLEVDRMPQRGYALTSLSVKAAEDVQNFIDQEQVGDFRLVRVQEAGKLAANKQYMINVSEQDFFWFQDTKKTSGMKSKEFMALLRETYTDMYNNLEQTGT